MKRTILTLAAILAPSAALAEEHFSRFYVGADYQYTNVDYQNYPALGINGSDLADEDLHGIHVHGGARFHQNFGLEVGAFWSEGDEKSNIFGTGINSEVEMYGLTLDAMGYLPVAQSFELIGTVGASYTNAEIDFSGAANATEDESELGGRVGVGAQYWLTDNLNLRGIVRYQTADFEDTADSAIVTNVGLNFQF